MTVIVVLNFEGLMSKEFVGGYGGNHGRKAPKFRGGANNILVRGKGRVEGPVRLSGKLSTERSVWCSWWM